MEYRRNTSVFGDIQYIRDRRRISMAKGFPESLKNPKFIGVINTLREMLNSIKAEENVETLLLKN